MNQPDIFFDNFVEWLLYKYEQVFRHHENQEKFAKIKNQVSKDPSFKLIFQAFIENTSGKSKKESIQQLTKIFGSLPQPVTNSTTNLHYETLEKILLSIFQDKENNKIGAKFLLNCVMVDYPEFKVCLQDKALKKELYKRDADGLSLLHLAIKYKSAGIISFIVNNVDDKRVLNIIDNEELTPLQQAVKADSEVIWAFKKTSQSNLEFGQSIVAGRCLLHYAIEVQAINFVQDFINSEKMDLSFHAGDDNTILHAAVFSGSSELVKFVVPFCQDFKDKQNVDRETALGLALQMIEELQQQKEVKNSADTESGSDLEDIYDTESGGRLDEMELGEIVQGLLNHQVNISYAQRQKIKFYAGKKIIPTDANVKQIISNDRKEIAFKLLLILGIGAGILPATKSAQFIGEAFSEGSYPLGGLALLLTTILVMAVLVKLTCTPFDKVTSGFIAARALSKRLIEKVNSFRYDNEVSNEASSDEELTAAQEKELFDIETDSEDEIEMTQLRSTADIMKYALKIKSNQSSEGKQEEQESESDSMQLSGKQSEIITYNVEDYLSSKSEEDFIYVP